MGQGVDTPRSPLFDARDLLLAWLGAALLTLLCYARFHEWAGGWCYGPRYLCETMPLLCLLFAAAYQRLRAAWTRCAAGVLVALSVAVQLVGVFGHHAHTAWQVRHTLPDQGRCLFSLHDTQIEAYSRALFRSRRPAAHAAAQTRSGSTNGLR